MMTLKGETFAGFRQITFIIMSLDYETPLPARQGVIDVKWRATRTGGREVSHAKHIVA